MYSTNIHREPAWLAAFIRTISFKRRQDRTTWKTKYINTSDLALLSNVLAFSSSDFNFLAEHCPEALFRSAHWPLSFSYRRSLLWIPKYLPCKVRTLPKSEQAFCVTQKHTGLFLISNPVFHTHVEDTSLALRP